MARPRTPLAKAALTGADKHDPQRFKSRSEPEKSGRPVGKPPAYLNPTAKKAWAIFVDEYSWLTFEDRAILEMASEMRARVMDRDPELTASFFANYRMTLSSMGGTPVDRTKVYQPPPGDEDDEFDRFIQ